MKIIPGVTNIWQGTGIKPVRVWLSKISGVYQEYMPKNYLILSDRCKDSSVERIYNAIADEGLPKSYTFIDNAGVKRIKPHLYLSGLQLNSTEPKGLGTGKKILQDLIQKSKKEGFEGRVRLNAEVLTGNPGNDHPAVKYYKAGFRALDKNTNQTLEKIAAREIPNYNLGDVPMYYQV